jgi:hypothetical protein
MPSNECSSQRVSCCYAMDAGTLQTFEPLVCSFVFDDKNLHVEGFILEASPPGHHLCDIVSVANSSPYL